MSLITGIDEISYGDVTFPTTAEITRFVVTPVYDRAGRTLVATTILLAVRSIWAVATGSTTDTYADDLREKLTRPGDRLIVTNRGLGGFRINSTTHGDIRWGPKPRLLSFRQRGVDKVLEVEWQVEVCISECAGVSAIGFPCEWNYRVSFDRDNGGYTTRTITGYLAIAMTRSSQSSRRLTNTADSYLEKLFPQPPEGFKRRSSAQISDDKCRLDYQIVDEQLPAPLPQGVIDCQASDTRNSDTQALAMWHGTLSASYELAPDCPKGVAYLHFEQLMMSRFNEIIKQSGGRRVPIIQGLMVSEPEIYGRRHAAFSIRYRCAGERGVLLSGLWRQVPGTSNRLWAQSLANSQFHPRGISRMRLDPNDDIILDLCTTASPKHPVAKPSAPKPEIPGLPRVLSNRKCPPLQLSWHEYHCEVRFEEIPEIVEHKLLPVNRTMHGGSIDNLPPSTPWGRPGKPGNKPPDQQFDQEQAEVPINVKLPDSVFQQVAQSSWYVYLIGSAERVCYEIPMPTIASVGGSPVVLKNRPGKDGFSCALVANDGLPLYRAKWHMRYQLLRAPGSAITPPPNPNFTERTLKGDRGGLINDLDPSFLK